MSSAVSRSLTRLLADAVSRPDPAGVALVMARLAGLNGRGWLRLDDLARRPFWGQPQLGDVTDWGPLLQTGAVTPGLIAASMSRDGRVRQAAVAVLGRLPGPVAAAGLAVRVADWVPAVSSAAVAAVAARSEPQDVAAIVPVLLVLGQRRRGRQAKAAYLERLADGPAGMLDVLAVTGERAGRLWALEILAERNLLAADVLMARALRDRDPVIALWCARRLAGSSAELPDDVARRLLGSGRAGVRAFAVGRAGDDQLTRPVLRELVLDRSGAVRSAARWRWTKRWAEDLGSLYREVLTGGARPRQIAAALRGLDEDHDNCLPAAAVPFLAGARSSVPPPRKHTWARGTASTPTWSP